MAKNVQMVRFGTAAASLYVGPIGQIIMDTGLNALRIQDGVTPGGFVTMIGNNNLADLASIPNARATLGLGSAALHDAGDFDVAGAASAAIVAAEAYTDASVAVINAFLTTLESDAASGYFYLPRKAVPAKPWLIQWKQVVCGTNNPTNQPGGVNGDIEVFNWPVAFPNAIRFGGVCQLNILANGNFITLTLSNMGTVSSEIVAMQGTPAGSGPFTAIAWGVGN